MIKEERAALPLRDGGSALDLRDVLQDALREKERGRIPPVVPDLIGEAFIIDALSKLTPAEQDGAVARSYRRSPDATAATVIRTAQDFAETEGHPTLSWIDGLAGQCATVEDLIPLVAALPLQSLQLRERAATITADLIERLRNRWQGRP